MAICRFAHPSEQAYAERYGEIVVYLGRAELAVLRATYGRRPASYV
jgi:hypothetical protein